MYDGGAGDGTGFIIRVILVYVGIYFAQIVWTSPPLTEAQLREAVVQQFPDAPRGFHEAIVQEQLRTLPSESVLTRWMVLDTDKVLSHGQVWRLFTYMLLHDPSRGGHWHIVANMWILFLVGARLVDSYGRREFLLFYIAGGFFAGLATIGFDVIMRDYNRCLGASGAVVAALVLYACNWPRQQWLFFFVIPMPVYVLVIIAALMDLVPIISQIAGNRVVGNIGHAAHLGGMAFGYVYHRSLWRLEPIYVSIVRFNWKRSSAGTALRARSRGLRVIHPEEEPIDMDRRVDELLQKISDQGEASLTDKERAFLMEASRRKRSSSGGP